MGYDHERITLVLNRADSQRRDLATTTCVAIVGRAPDILVPSDRDIARSVNEGKPIVAREPRSDAARAFQRARRASTQRQTPRTEPSKRKRPALLRSRRKA